MTIALKRVYDPVGREDGVRVLVERLWPRGISRDAAALDHWFRELAPSPDLRKWYDHKIERWPEFQQRYRRELETANPELLAELESLCRERNVTFVYAARDEERNSATLLRSFILERMA